MAAADEPFIRGRPALAAGKYTKMASSTFDFFRGTVPLYRSDFRTGTTTSAQSSFALDVPLVPSLGDPHPENFGVLRARDGSMAIEANDFDASDRMPYLWDVRRLAVGMALAAIFSNPEDPALRKEAEDARHAIARAAVVGYRSALEDAARGDTIPRITPDDPRAQASAAARDVFRRSERDQAIRRELGDLSVLAEDGQRTFKRGAIDPEDPQSLHSDLPPFAMRALQGALDRYRQSLIAPPPPEYFRVLDAVRQFGSGVASWARVRALILVRGPTDDPSDDVVLEIKELQDSGGGGLYGVGVHHDSVGDRILATTRGAWARVDAEPLWGVTQWLGFPCQVRRESEGQKGFRVERLAESEGSVDEITRLGEILGRLVARAHSSGARGLENARAIYKLIAADPERFADEQADFGVGYADLVREDAARFRRAIQRKHVGLRLGVPFDPTDTPSPDLLALYGAPR